MLYKERALYKKRTLFKLFCVFFPAETFLSIGGNIQLDPAAEGIVLPDKKM